MSIVLPKYHRKQSGSSVSGRRCTAPQIALRGMIKVVPTTKIGLRRQLPSCNDCIGGWFHSSTITIPAVWRIGHVANIWTEARGPFTLESASTTTKWHFNRVGMRTAVDFKWLSRLVPIQRSTVSYLGGLCSLHSVDPVQRTIRTACLSHWEDVTWLLLCFSGCSLHHWDDWNTERDQRSLWSRQISWNTKQCDSVAPLLALHTTRPSLQAFWFLVAGFSPFAS